MTQANGSNGTLSPKQRDLLVALLAGKKVDEAAESAKISRRTAFRWQAEPTFRAAMKKERRKLFEQTLEHLMAGTSTALKVLLDTMNNQKAPYSVRVQAARCWLEQAIMIHKTEELEDAIAEMQELLKGDRFVSLY